MPRLPIPIQEKEERNKIKQDHTKNKNKNTLNKITMKTSIHKSTFTLSPLLKIQATEQRTTI